MVIAFQHIVYAVIIQISIILAYFITKRAYFKEGIIIPAVAAVVNSIGICVVATVFNPLSVRNAVGTILIIE